MDSFEGRLERLIDTRDRLAGAIEGCESSRDLPGLSREYRMVLAEIDSLHTEVGVDAVDELTARRSAKDSGGAEAPPKRRRARD
jgi:hypothetical protein